MKVNFYATLRLVSGRKTVEFEVAPGSTVRSLLDSIFERFPSMREELLDESGELRGHVHVFVNGRDAESMDAVLTGEDKIDVFPAVAGG